MGYMTESWILEAGCWSQPTNHWHWRCSIANPSRWRREPKIDPASQHQHQRQCWCWQGSVALVASADTVVEHMLSAHSLRPFHKLAATELLRVPSGVTGILLFLPLLASRSRTWFPSTVPDAVTKPPWHPSSQLGFFIPLPLPLSRPSLLLARIILLSAVSPVV